MPGMPAASNSHCTPHLLASHEHAHDPVSVAFCPPIDIVPFTFHVPTRHDMPLTSLGGAASSANAAGARVARARAAERIVLLFMPSWRDSARNDCSAARTGLSRLHGHSSV